MAQELGLRCSWVAPDRRFAHAPSGALLAGPVSESVRARSLASLSSRLSPALRLFTLALSQVLAEARATAHLVISGDPRVRQRLTTLVEHLQRQLMPGAMADLVLGHAGVSAALAVLRPLLGQVQPDVGDGVLLAADVAEVDADLAVID